MITLDPNWTEDVMRIVIDCDEVLKSSTSEAEKDKAKIKAFDEIKELILSDNGEDVEDE